MCGLTALFAYDDRSPPVDGGELAAINGAMAARGPDGEGTWTAPDGRLGLAHRRLAIIDPDERANQPMRWVPPGRGAGYGLTYNGEIYNFRDLREELIARGHRMVTESDTEVLLHLFAEHGIKMCDRLRGMYAFALWDEAEQTLWLARDPLGIKPLYYADDGRCLRAASQVKALRAGGRVPHRPDPAAQAAFFLTGSVPEGLTALQDIRELPAGRARCWRRGEGLLDREHAIPGPESLLDAVARTRPADPPPLRRALMDTIAHHFVADVPVGAFLSGGRDSASLVALASELKGGNLRTLTLAFDEFAGTPLDEAPLAEAVARACDTQHQTHHISAAVFRAARADLLAAMDQPTIDGVNVYFVARAAKAAGMKVALSGLGGDELFGGYDTFEQVPRLVGLAGRLPGARGLGRLWRQVSAPWIHKVASPKVASVLELGTTLGDAYLLRRGLFLPHELPLVMPLEAAREGWTRVRDRLAVTAGIGGQDLSPRQKVAALEITTYMRTQLLRDADWAGMAHSLEIRVPLVDMALYGALAPVIGGAPGYTKADMARTPRHPLPGAVLDRPKTGFFIPVHDWLMAQDGAPPGRLNRGLRGWAGQVWAAQVA
ncbi:MAG: asparagine synthase (glutamine-hydrolyzing) [Rhodobacterales bacterium]|nr:asparagine synthase (glutamine-hydrolyzing) [Rhodobacterales bacterium]